MKQADPITSDTDMWYDGVGPKRYTISLEDATKWCIHHQSDGRFISPLFAWPGHQYRSAISWKFENEKDALMFTLKWSNVA